MSYRNEQADGLNHALDVAAGNVTGRTVVHKFGAATVGTSFVPITSDNIYNTPQVAGALAMRVKAGGNANDTAAGTGAREITIEGLDETGAEASEAVATAGASASAATTTTFIRVYRVYVSASGTYATAAAGSHTASIVIEDSGGAGDWASINLDGFPLGQSEIGVYTVPLGFTAYISSIALGVDSTKSVDIIGFKRENILETAAPYTPMKAFLRLDGVSGAEDLHPVHPFGPFPALTDVGFMALVASSTADVDVDFEIVLIAD